MKHLKKILLLVIGLYVVTLGLVYVDVFDSSPIISLFKKIQTDSALEVVDFSVEKESVDKVKPVPNKDRNPYYGDLHVHTKYSFG